MLWFQLAWRFGCPVAELQDRMSFAEYLEWNEYLSEVPGGDAIANWRDAQIASAIYRTTCAKKADDFPLKDFLPRYQDREEEAAKMCRDPVALFGVLRQYFNAQPVTPNG